MTSMIQDYAIIGDGHSCALVARTGSIDFLCWPRFDSDACFAALLGDERHGCWLISPSGYVAETTRRYRPDTATLETEHVTETGRVRVTDLMPWHDGATAIVRLVEGVDGEVEMATSLRLRFGNGQIVPWAQAHERGLIFESGPDRVTLDAAVALEKNADDATARFSVGKHDKLAFVLSHSPSTAPAPPVLDVDAVIQATDKAWKGWIGRLKSKCGWGASLRRSLITLRLLTDRDSGGIAAAATFGLPEIPGGPANWDYRYCWLRDSTFMLTALLNAGFHEEAQRWRDWILRAIGGRPTSMQIVYRLDGSRRLDEYEFGALPGYQGSVPVRIGNAASGQVQLDVFGELLDSFDVLARAGIERSPRVVELETAIVEHLERIWDQPSADIWENRNDPQRYTYSQVMAWVGVTRFVAAHADDERIDRALIARLKTLSEVIHRTVCERGYSTERGHFVHCDGGDALDASLLLLPLVGFLPADDPRIADTIAAIEQNLMEGGLVRRKPLQPDGHDEGAFIACSCWLADCYKMQGRDEEAATLLERVIGLANDVGLLSEEYSVRNRSPLGNIPQALSHLGLINTALFLSGPVLQRAGG
ncbi:glycoside hydrolase family 15 protein [Solimonas marina]|uniref:Glycoside hydrolase family 15 protein n=1 Tax=Solimonas marina TaxID=2714601 RepID=A0A970B6E9_9GAMM|nr:glycoside hydrolase family 15 protein [Solimonas marina]NKF24397.1 glycoside hydrolase family 15 protein [Solimonas marina]